MYTYTDLPEPSLMAHGILLYITEISINLWQKNKNLRAKGNSHVEINFVLLFQNREIHPMFRQ